MARKITVNMYMTLDGKAEFPKYPGSDAVSVEPDEAFKDMWIDRYASVDTVIFGRRAFEDHQNFHSEAARKPSDPEFLFEFSRYLDITQKIVLSHYMKEAGWKNSRIMGGDLEEIVADLKQQPGRDIIVDGGPSVVQEFMQLGLADDYMILVFPVIHGKGKDYWSSMLNQRTLRLVSAKNLEYGELVLHYEDVKT